MDIASIIGMVMCGFFLIYGICSGDDGVAALGNFYDFSSILITFGGAICATLASHTLSDFLAGLKSFLLIFKTPALDTPQIISKIIELSNVARKEGLLSLEEAAADLDDAFLKKGILLIVDGTDPELVRGIMDTELGSIDARHKKRIGFWEALGAMGPAWGMIGTLIGLINMLKNMSDVTSVGPNMSVALVTTFYGSVLANWLCTPVSAKLKADNDAEIEAKEIMVEGLLSIQAGENPRVIEEKLKSFLAPKDRTTVGEEEAEVNG